MTKLEFKLECIVKELNETKQKKLIVKVTQYYYASLVDQILVATISPNSFRYQEPYELQISIFQGSCVPTH